jgi:hypothetical protein
MFCHVFDRHPSFSLSVNAGNRIPSGACHPHLEYDADLLPETRRILYLIPSNIHDCSLDMQSINQSINRSMKNKCSDTCRFQKCSLKLYYVITETCKV